MKTFADVEQFRSTKEAVEFALGWIKAQQCGEVTSSYHMNLLAWSSGSPFHVLGIVLDLIDRVGEDEQCAEMIAMGPVEWLVEHAPEDFLSILREAVAAHPGFALYTQWKRENAREGVWKQLGSNPGRGKHRKKQRP
jgi:hypothetical protein